MKPPYCALTPEGYPAIFFSALGALVFAMLDCPVLAVLFFVLCWFALNFFRDPERVVPDEEKIAVSPADGRVVKLERREDPISGENRLCICIFMNVFNVHVNRVPVQGTITDIKYYPGKFFNASLDKASKDNERCAYQLTDEQGQTWTFVQIAGLIARRIVCRVEKGDTLARGERFGMIRFGSRVDLYVPDGYIPTVSCGQEVLGGQTVIARRLTE
ncbi:MAG TPA: phosphatidylserine decarboxylase family protein [Candidatus Desulfovibrio intestinipullorum]|uniref:Phosphatidylserine decarboxylase proenzyme n=1 Tax=Candidatus Desulfovibrio intestinipullorum TaxID=2838536 RepID=A0A9D1PX54_9BACT|nr:phosphatidylserine decarboxylase family protein [Candidatus Desulfovibrio intestinipullorum]